MNKSHLQNYNNLFISCNFMDLRKIYEKNEQIIYLNMRGYVHRDVLLWAQIQQIAISSQYGNQIRNKI
ncbi:unnamed protein product [Paramecium octaurelia]|uniref:Uncharacterized protein n=1 Tax=Paramecium octaurelia TaxID=43137 RepID=A0A8S1U407_PAROT|nr:unnamed protein product [Paramecium octaurelia]